MLDRDVEEIAEQARDFVRDFPDHDFEKVVAEALGFSKGTAHASRLAASRGKMGWTGQMISDYLMERANREEEFARQLRKAAGLS